MTGPCSAKLPLSGALAILRATALPLPVEAVPIAWAGLRVLGEQLRARTASPRGDVAAMDGFAVRDADLRAGHREFAVAGATYAGATRGEVLDAISAHRIMTGALVPPPADRVIPWELVTETFAGIRVEDPLPLKSHVRAEGSDFAADRVLLEPGTVLDGPRLLLAAAADRASLQVHRRPRVRVLSSGDELVPPGFPKAEAGCVPESLTLPLLLLSKQWGAEALGAEVVRDDEREIAAAASAAVADCDILVMVGGASGGDRDLARSGLVSLGLDMAFSSVAIRPGKPAWYGRIGRTHVVGLPGNPAAALVVARLFVAPLTCALAGREFDAALQWRAMPAAHSLPAGDDRESLLFARQEGGRAHVVEGQSASSQFPLAQAEMIMRRAAGAPPLTAGDLVAVLDI